MRNSIHTQKVKDQALQLYFEIEKHFALGGNALSMRDVNRMLGLSSSASAQVYVDILRKWGLINHEPKSVRTIILAKTNYPPVEWRKIDKGD